MATKKSDMENERNEQNKTDDKTEFNLFNWPLGKKALIAVIGIIATVLISDFVLHYVERNFPNVYFDISVDGTYPCIHFLSDDVNEYTVATLDYKIPVQLSLENDNKVPIRISSCRCNNLKTICTPLCKGLAVNIVIKSYVFFTGRQERVSDKQPTLSSDLCNTAKYKQYGRRTTWTTYGSGVQTLHAIFTIT